MYSKDLTCSFTLRLTEEDLRYLSFRAMENDISVSRYVRWLISDDRLFHEAESEALNPDNGIYN